jgi:hypothetical protein
MLEFSEIYIIKFVTPSKLYQIKSQFNKVTPKIPNSNHQSTIFKLQTPISKLASSNLYLSLEAETSYSPNNVSSRCPLYLFLAKEARKRISLPSGLIRRFWFL